MNNSPCLHVTSPHMSWVFQKTIHRRAESRGKEVRPMRRSKLSPWKALLVFGIVLLFSVGCSGGGGGVGGSTTSSAKPDTSRSDREEDASENTVAEFYKGKTITITVGASE